MPLFYVPLRKGKIPNSEINEVPSSTGYNSIS